MAATRPLVEADLAHLVVGEHADDDGVGALGDGHRSFTAEAPKSLYG